MVDVFSKEKRSSIMRQVKSKNTKPELIFRKALHKKGFRYRLHVSRLPGKPDIVLPKYKTIIQIRGCFWHGHSCKAAAKLPASNTQYWTKKISKNKCRDKKNDAKLRKLGWHVITVWECHISTYNNLQKRLDKVIRKMKQDIDL